MHALNQLELEELLNDQKIRIKKGGDFDEKAQIAIAERILQEERNFKAAKEAELKQTLYQNKVLQDKVKQRKDLTKKMKTAQEKNDLNRTVTDTSEQLVDIEVKDNSVMTDASLKDDLSTFKAPREDNLT